MIESGEGLELPDTIHPTEARQPAKTEPSVVEKPIPTRASAEQAETSPP